MPTSMPYPGVFIQEEASGVRTIAPTGTSVTAFAGSTERGPVTIPTLVSSLTEYMAAFGPVSARFPTSLAVYDYFANGGGQALVVRAWQGDAATDGPTDGVAHGAVEGYEVHARSPGTWANDIEVAVTVRTAEAACDVVLRRGGAALETYLGLGISPAAARPMTDVVNSRSALVRVTAVEGTPPQTGSDTLSGGSDGVAPTLEAHAGYLHAMGALRRADFNLLCLPPWTVEADCPIPLGEAAAVCHEVRAMLLVDPPAAWNRRAIADGAMLSGAIAGLTLGDHREDAIVVYPRLLPRHPYLAPDRAFVPCGAIAGIIARTDRERGVWKAPAGTDAGVTGIIDPADELTDDQNGALNRRGINCLRTFPVHGTVLWGSRTAAGDDALGSEFKYVPVRRLTLHIERSLARGLQWVVFEPNDEPLWAQIRLNVGVFMNDLFRQGAFKGTSARDAYFVRCDRGTTTQSDIDQGVVNIVVGFAPLKPAEFVIVRLQQLAGQLSV